MRTTWAAARLFPTQHRPARSYLPFVQHPCNPIPVRSLSGPWGSPGSVLGHWFRIPDDQELDQAGCRSGASLLRCRTCSVQPTSQRRSLRQSLPSPPLCAAECCGCVIPTLVGTTRRPVCASNKSPAFMTDLLLCTRGIDVNGGP